MDITIMSKKGIYLFIYFYQEDITSNTYDYGSNFKNNKV